MLRFSVINTSEAILAYVYKIEKPIDQLVFRVENELRQIISGMTLNDLYANKDHVADRIIADQATNALETGLRIELFGDPAKPSRHHGPTVGRSRSEYPQHKRARCDAALIPNRGGR